MQSQGIYHYISIIYSHSVQAVIWSEVIYEQYSAFVCKNFANICTKWWLPLFISTIFCFCLMTGRTEMTALAWECQEIFMAAIVAFHEGKSFIQVPAIEAPVNDLLQIRPLEFVSEWKRYSLSCPVFMGGCLIISVLHLCLRRQNFSGNFFPLPPV